MSRALPRGLENQCPRAKAASLTEPRAERAAGPRERAVPPRPKRWSGAGPSGFSASDRSLRPEFCRIPAPRSRLRTPGPACAHVMQKARSEPRAERAAGPRERAVTPRPKRWSGAGPSGFSAPNRSLWPEFCRIPAPRSRLRTPTPVGADDTQKARSEPRAERAAGPRERAVTCGG